MHAKTIARAAIALAALTVGVAFAAETPSSDASVVNDSPVLLAQAPTATRAAPASQAHPDYQAGVRAAAAKGPEALRQYTNRTRMIYNFYYWDFALDR